MLSHRNIIANMQQAHAWLRPVLEEGRETIVTALPLYHVFALTCNCMTFLKIGGTNVLVTNPRDIPGFVKELGRRPFSVITGVNTLFNALLNNPEFARLDFTPLRVSVAGGMAVQKAVAERWKQVTGKALIEGYGLTEASPFVAVNPLDLADYNGSIGLPLPSTAIAIRDDEDREVTVGEVGELCVRGPQVMQGYWHKPAETANVVTPDGFLRTGDLAAVDAGGFIRIVDRKKDMIIVSGFKVFPNEVEDVIAMCPGVLEAGVFGVPDANSGQAVWAAIVRKDPALTDQDVIAHCRRHLTGYKIPRHVTFRDELPKSPIGKVLRRALSEEVQKAAC
jgi:long-chain acyl-CoA synthetase